MSDPQPDRIDSIRPRDGGEEHGRSSASARAEPKLRDPSGASAAASSAPGPGPAAAAAQSDVQPPTAQMPTQPPQSPPLRCPLHRLATVELQLCLQFLDTKSKLIAARCSHRLLQAADHSLAWRGPCVSVSFRRQPQPGSLIRSSLLRNAPIALHLDCDLTPAEVAAIPRLRELVVSDGWAAELVPRLLPLPSLQGLQTLRALLHLPLQMLPSLPALHTLECWELDEYTDWSWLPAMPALTELHLRGQSFQPLSQPLLDALGRCASLRSLRLCDSLFDADAFARLCSVPPLRHLTLEGVRARSAASTNNACAAFSALSQLESIRLAGVHGIDLLLPHLAHAPALRTLIIPCSAIGPFDEGTAHPSRETLHQLLTAALRLQVQLHMAATIEEWRKSCWYSMTTAPSSDQMDDQWRELQRTAAELERVTVVDRAIGQ